MLELLRDLAARSKGAAAALSDVGPLIQDLQQSSDVQVAQAAQRTHALLLQVQYRLCHSSHISASTLLLNSSVATAALALRTVVCRCRCQAELGRPPARRARQAGSLLCRRPHRAQVSSLAAQLEAVALKASGQGMRGHLPAAGQWHKTLQLASQAALSQAQAVLQA